MRKKVCAVLLPQTRRGEQIFGGWTNISTLCKVWKMKTEPLQPTLWRTCRVLANRNRLRILAQLVRRQPQTVSQLAACVSFTLPVASQSLRALESRGLLKVKRIRRRVEYHTPSNAEAGALADLIAALKTALRREPVPTARIIKLATAFTHPSRIGIYRYLHGRRKTRIQIQSGIPISAPALSRHLGKLVARGFVKLDDVGRCTAIKHPEAIGQALAALAVA